MLACQDQADALVKIVNDDRGDDDDIETCINKIARQVLNDCKTINLDLATYKLALDITAADECI